MARKKEIGVVVGTPASKAARKAQQYSKSGGGATTNNNDGELLSTKSANSQSSGNDAVSSADSTAKRVSPTDDAADARRKPKDAYLQPNDQNYINFRNQLRALGLTLRDIQGDGNCLFRALGDQQEGHPRNHHKHRMDTVRYMIQHRADFEPFMDQPFDRYVDNLSRLGTYAGQDALVAFARLNRVNIVIHQLNSPIWQIVGTEDGVGVAVASGGGSADVRELHLSYHNGEHYSSVRLLGDHANTPANVRLGMRPSPHAKTNSGGVVASCCLAASTAAINVAAKTTVAASAGNTKLKTVQASHNKGSLGAFCDSATEDDGIESGAEQLLLQPSTMNTDPAICQLMEHSGCQDPSLAEEVLIDHQFNFELALDYLINLTTMLGTPVVTPPPTDTSTSIDGGNKKLSSRRNQGNDMNSDRPPSLSGAADICSAVSHEEIQLQFDEHPPKMTKRERKELKRNEKAQQRRRCADAGDERPPPSEAVVNDGTAVIAANASLMNL